MLFDRSLLSAAAILALIAPIYAHAVHKPRQVPSGILDCDRLDDIDGEQDDDNIPGLQYPATCTTQNNGMTVTSVKPAINAPLTAANVAAQTTGIPSNGAPPAGGRVYDCDDIDDDDDDDNNGTPIVFPATCTTENNGQFQTSVRSAAGASLTGVGAADAPPTTPTPSAGNTPPPAQGMVYDCDDVDDDMDIDGNNNNDDDSDDDDDDDDNNNNNNNNNINSATLVYPLTCTTQRNGATQTYIRSASGAAFASATPGATGGSGSSTVTPTSSGPAPTGTSGDNDNDDDDDNNNYNNDGQSSTFTGAAGPMATAGFREAVLGGGAAVIGAIAFGL